ncbi:MULTISPECIES: response regulator transcription factor [Actinomyces]|uniref:Response regulator transcription factor n=1 Tax=Actinomyces respiraculi TaxID=2744574 RepID=A0A7T0LKR7_9ACTO|nr:MULTISPECIES: response regulator transcription factor [Actinomyces]QPL05572.1 response regulator transcription factor [Actinomyces respiraculi]
MTADNPARIIIVDDEPIIRDGLTMYLDSAEEIEVVARLSNGAEALNYLASHRVDLVLMDVRMPVMDGPTALARMTAEYPEVPVLLMTSFDDEQIVYRVLSQGGRGYLLKSASSEEIRAAIRAVLAGGVPVSPSVNAGIVREAVTQHARRPEPRDFGLSEREEEVLRLLCRAAPNREIAHQLCLSESTVKAYVSSIMMRMGCSSRLHIVVTAFEHGLVSPGR